MFLQGRAFELLNHLTMIDSVGRCGDASGTEGKVNRSRLNGAHHCFRWVFDVLAVGQNLSGESRPGPRLQFVSTQEGWQHKAEDVGGDFNFPNIASVQFHLSLTCTMRRAWQRWFSWMCLLISIICSKHSCFYSFFYNDSHWWTHTLHDPSDLHHE